MKSKPYAGSARTRQGFAIPGPGEWRGCPEALGNTNCGVQGIIPWPPEAS